jgi:hypothetical protein
MLKVRICDVHSFSGVKAFWHLFGTKGADLESTEDK